ncbi:MAG: hypothetical protein JNL88_07465 [Bacteroidia bacterium]|nr:hypothetical protein [Bacteroidia bacterium]
MKVAPFIPPLRILRGGVLFIALILIFTGSGFAQEGQTAAAQKSLTVPDTSSGKVHSVKKATLLSTFLPGAGQVYNRKIWKVPVIYAAFAGMGYLIKFNHDNYKKFDKALLLRYDEDPGTVDEYANIYTEDNLKSLSDFYRRNRDLSYIGFTVIYVLNIIDAHVDAHLFNFSVDDNISLQWSPLVQPAPGMANAGLSLTLSF